MSAETAHERVQRLTHWCVTGRLVGAELELVGWSRQPDCPAAAHLLLATVLAQRDALDEARHVLARIDVHADPEIARTALELLYSLSTVQGGDDLARQYLTQLEGEHGSEPGAAAWLATMDASLSAEDANPAAAHLSADLASQIEIIPSLVAAQRHEPDAQVVPLLRTALQHLHATLVAVDHKLVVCQALAELAMLAGDQHETRYWAQRGLQLHPMHVTLALLLAELDGSTTADAVLTQTLRHVAAVYPQYPDLQAALIRNEVKIGAAQAARAHLQAWLKRAPHNPLALQVQQELAA